MIKITGLHQATLRFVLILGGILAVPSLLSAQSCDNVTDAQIVAAVYAKFKGDSKLAPQVSHINVVSVNAAVQLQGWVNNKNDFERAVELVSLVRCVRVINVNLFEPNPPENLQRGGSCGAGMKACGDICIPVSDTCGIMSDE